MAVHRIKLLCGITGQVSQNPQFHITIDVCDLPHIFLGETMLDFFWNAPLVILQLIFVILFWSGIIFGGYVIAKELLDNYVDRKVKFKGKEDKPIDPNNLDDDDYIGV